MTSSIPYSLICQFMECDCRNDNEGNSMIAKTQYSVTSSNSRSPVIVIVSIDIYRNPRGPTSMIQPTLNSSDYHVQIPIFRAQFNRTLSEIPFRLRHCFPSPALSQAIELCHKSKRGTDIERIILMSLQRAQQHFAYHGPSRNLCVSVCCCNPPSLCLRTCKMPCHCTMPLSMIVRS